MKQIIALLCLQAVVCLDISAQTFTATYNFSSVTTSSGTTDPTPVPTATGATFASFQAFGTPANPNAAGRFSFIDWATGAINGSNVFTGSVNTSEYYEVTIAPQPGFSVDLTTITFTLQRSGTGIRQYAVRSSLDGYTANLPASINPANTNLQVVAGNIFQVSDATANAENGSTVTLSAFTGLSTAVTFRFYGWNSEASTGTFSIDNVVFSGAVNTVVDPNASSLTVNPTSLTFPTTGAGSTSASLSYSLTGTNLQNDVTVSTTSPYSVSIDDINFSASINIAKTDPALASGKTIYARFSPATAGTFNTSISNVSTGAETKTVTVSGVGIGLIHLTSSPYLENFNGIAGGLPSGVTTKTGATGSTLGIDAPFTSSPATWSNTSAGFKNFASGNNDQGVNQNSATDRAMGVRQTGAFGDPGAAFVFQIANTTGKINFALDFNLQSLDATSPRTTTWRIDYGFGANPSTFIIPTTSGNLTTGGNTFSNNPVHVTFGNALDNQPGIVTIRIVALTASSGSLNRASTGIDDFTLSWEDPTAKTISLNTTSLSFPTTNIGSSNTAQYTIVSQTNLDQPIDINATAPYAISTDNQNFVSQLSIAPADAFNKTIYVKFSPVAPGVYPGTITHNSVGAPSKIINLSGEAIDPASLGFNFNTCSVSSIPGSGFLSINVTGSQKWGCSQFGRNSTNGVSVNGFSSGPQTNDAWLISPPLNLNSITNIPVLSFYSRGEFSGPKLQLYVSTSYNGSGTPDLADWTEISGNFPTPPGAPTTTWTLSDNIDLSSYKPAPVVYIAFRYTSSPVLNAARWSVDDIAITDQSTLLTVDPSELNFGEVSVGSNSLSQPLNLHAIGSTDLTITPPPGYQISTDNNTFTPNNIIVDQATAAAGTTLYVRFSPIEKALKVEGNINVSAEGLDKNVVALTGSSFPRAETFDVACYNISFFGSNSTNSATPEEIATQVANISTVMQNLNADVIGIEEMSNDAALAQLTANLPGYASVVSPRWSYSFEPPDPEFPPQKVGFIYNTATMSLSGEEPPRVMFETMYDSARLNLPGHRLGDYPTGTPSSFWASGRLPFMATFNATIDDVTQKIRIVVIHAKSGGDADGYTRRQYDVKVLKDTLDAFYANDKILIVGDYNDRVVTSIFAGHQSSYKPFVDDDVNYKILTQPLDSAGKASFPGDAGMIDHITISNDVVNEYIPNSTEIEDARTYIPNYNSTTASDHLPVFSRYQFCKLTCPENISVSNDAGQCGAIVHFNISSSMTCGTVTAVPPSGSFFAVGNTSVQVTASTGETCSFTVTVADNENPAITVPTDIITNNDPGTCYATIASLGTAMTSDNCEVQSVTNDAPQSGQFPIGTSTVIWTVTDIHGKSATAAQTITVVDNENPIVVCMTNQTRNMNPNQCSYAVSGVEFDATTTDNCNGVSILNDYNHSSSLADAVFNKGQTTVTWTATDAAGNTATCSFEITVEDRQNPLITAPSSVTVTPNNSGCTAKNVTLGSPITSDNCVGESATNNAPAVFQLGTTIVTWTVTDASGNSASAAQSITVAVNPPIVTSINDEYAVSPGGAANTIYLGYGPSSLTLHGNVSGGGGGYSYKWTIGSSAGPPLNSTSSYTVSPGSTSTYYFNVKDQFDCSAPVATKTVNVVDVRCGPKNDKVTVCQLVKGNQTTNCINSNNVATALAGGATLGSCINTITRAPSNPEITSDLLTVTVAPNPSGSYFTIMTTGTGPGKLRLRVTDMLGRQIEQNDNLQPNNSLRLGEKYFPGVYIVEIMQGDIRKQVKVIKVGN